MATSREEKIIASVVKWVEENEHNPDFKFVVGNRAFSPEEIKDNIKKGTPEGEMILDMVTDTATHLFLKARPT